jgi:hypothetical protein
MFKGTPGPVKSLRRFYKDRTKLPILDGLKSELEGESDRAAILLITSFVDDVLCYRLGKHLSFEPTRDELDYVFRFEGPLGTFSARIEVARLFGAIDENIYQRLELLSEMRNVCAHTTHPIKLSDPVLRPVLDKFLYPPLGGLEGRPGSEDEPLRELLMLECSIVAATLTFGSRETAMWALVHALDKAGELDKGDPSFAAVLRQRVERSGVRGLIRDDDKRDH